MLVPFSRKFAAYTPRSGILGALAVQARGYATHPGHMFHPHAPPREFNADGTPKKYRLNQFTYDHKYDWERWTLMHAGVFHTVYMAEFAKDLPWYWAWLGQFPVWVGVIPVCMTALIFMILVQNLGSIGIRPKRFTVEWIEASKERDRAENSNPVTNYLDRRRAERGPNWLLQDYMPHHPYFLWMRDHHDTELLRAKAAEKSDE